MNITVIVCTFDRCRNLQRALSSVAASTMPESVQWEVLVVNNNCSDQTPEVVDEFCRRYPGRFRHLFEPQPGKSYALNTAVRQARGHILAFTDDDVIVEPTWLENLTSSLHNSEWAGSAGRIVLTWPSPLPRWLSTKGKYSRHPFPGFDQGNRAKELTGPPFGANMAIRKSMFDKYGGFRTDLGPSPNRDTPPHSEDTEFVSRLIAAGEQLWYEPSAVVHHPVAESRIDKKYFLAWWRHKGRADVRQFESQPVHLLCSVIAWTLRWLVAADPCVRFYRKQVVWMKAGAIAECYRLRARMRS